MAGKSSTPLLTEDRPTTGLHAGPVTREMSLTPAAPVSMLANIDQLAKDVDVDKLQKLIDMNERILAHQARAEFYMSFADMQGELPTVEERGRSNNGAYALHEDIIEAVKPILKRHGFMLTFRTEFPDATTIKVTGILAHRSGHSERTEFLSKADTSGNKNAIQALGSAQSYGQRYNTRALLNIASRESDDDGRGTEQPPSPEGYEDWLIDLAKQAHAGTKALFAAWNKSKPELRNYVTKHERDKWENLKTTAAKAGV